MKYKEILIWCKVELMIKCKDLPQQFKKWIIQNKKKRNQASVYNLFKKNQLKIKFNKMYKKQIIHMITHNQFNSKIQRKAQSKAQKKERKKIKRKKRKKLNVLSQLKSKKHT